MRRYTLLTLLAITCVACATRVYSSSIAYRKQVVLSVPVHVVYVNLDDRNVKVTAALPRRGRGSCENVWSMVSRIHPSAAVTGTFFDTRSLLPTGDIVIAGVFVHSGCLGSALCITSDNHAEIIAHKTRMCRPAKAYETLVAGGMTLVCRGRVALNPRAEGFSDPAVFRAARRTAVGVTAQNKLILVTVNKRITLHRLAKVMVVLGADQSMLLDGGSSTSMYANGQLILAPARRLTNLLVVYEAPESYRTAAGQLAPSLLSADKVMASEGWKWTDEGTLHRQPWYRGVATASANLDPLPKWSFRLNYHPTTESISAY